MGSRIIADNHLIPALTNHFARADDNGSNRYLAVLSSAIG
jgi:hypothetical protein